MGKNILVAVTGKVPHVITEALWYFLTVQRTRFDRLVIVTTGIGEEVILRGDARRGFPKLLGKAGKLNAFAQEYGIDPPVVEMAAITDSNDRRLDDLRSGRDFEVAAYHILDTIRKLELSDDDRAICIFSGGRRLMASYLMSALVLVGRANHRLFYIGLDPQEVDTLPDFFYPARSPVVLDLPSGPRRSDTVSVIAEEVLFPRLGDKYAGVVEKDTSYSAIVKHVQSYVSAEKRPIVSVYDPIDQEPKILGTDPNLLKALQELKLFAQKGYSPVVIQGETGTGKELFAKFYQYWYHLGRHSKKKMLVFNCAAIPQDILESELFGYHKGAFTGADIDREGKLEQADGGVAFLDEVNSTAPQFQAALLRFLESGEIQKLGARSKGAGDDRKVDVRVVMASNEDLASLVDQGKMRDDFFQRVANPTVVIPPLRERKGDIPLLVETFIAKACERFGKPGLSFSQELMKEMMGMQWSGNVRELQRFVETTVLLSEEFPAITRWPKKPLPGSQRQRMGSALTYDTILNKIVGEGYQECRLKDRVEAFERWMLMTEYDRCDQNAAKLASSLRTPVATIKDRLKRLGVT